MKRFEKIFSVESIPDLQVQTYKISENLNVVGWSWNPQRNHDLLINKDDRGNIILFSGYVTKIHNNSGVTNGNESSHLDYNYWNKHGDNYIKEIDGSWSILFHDAATFKTTVYTDQYASRSVWTYRENNSWILSNYPSSILAIAENSLRLDPAGLYSLFFSSRHIPGRGLYNNMTCLTGGSKLIIDRDSNTKKTSWYYRIYSPDLKPSPREWGQIIAEALKNSASEHRTEETNPYLFLSGGLDSRVAAGSLDSPLTSVTLCNHPNMETKTASRISKIINIDNKTIVRSPYWYLDTIKAAALASSGNNLTKHSHFIIPAIEILEADHKAYFLLGDLLENFNKNYFKNQTQAKALIQNEDFEGLFLNCIPGVTKDIERTHRLFNKDIVNRMKTQWKHYISKSYKLSEEVSPELSDRLDTYLRWNDISTTYTYNMMTSLRLFAPERNIFFNQELGDISLRIPSTLRSKGVIHFWILWYLNSRLTLVPNANDFLPVFLPKKLSTVSRSIRPLLGRVRRSFHRSRRRGPINQTSGSWQLNFELYRKDSRHIEYIRNLIQDPTLWPEEIFNLSELEQLWDDFMAGETNLIFNIDTVLTFGTLNRLLPASGLAL